MAGAGYKLFATGDVLTAAQVNTYLMQQTVMVFASSAARTTALSGVLAEGMVSYLQDSNTLEVYDGSAWVGATGDITGLTAGTGISISSATGPVPTVTNSMATEITAKGDLIVGTGSGTFDNLAAGSNGDTLVADSSTSTGLRWQAPATLNTIINGGMDVWQRGTSGTATASVYYTADRWYVYAVTNSPFARSTSVPTGAGCQYSLEVTGATSGTDIYIGQRIESANIAPIKGTVTVSAYIYNETGASVTPTLRLDRPQAVDNYSSADQTSYTLQACANNAWTRVTQTVDISALSNIDNGLALIFFGWQMSANTKKVRITGVKIEKGSVATQFVRSAGTIQGELAACQRYYEKSYDQGTAPATATLNGIYWGSGSAASATTSYLNTALRYAVVKRVAPTLTLYDGAGTANVCTRSTLGVGDNNGQSVTAGQNGTSGANIYSTGTSNTTFFFHYVANAEL